MAHAKKNKDEQKDKKRQSRRRPKCCGLPMVTAFVDGQRYYQCLVCGGLVQVLP